MPDLPSSSLGATAAPAALGGAAAALGGAPAAPVDLGGGAAAPPASSFEARVLAALQRGGRADGAPAGGPSAAGGGGERSAWLVFVSGMLVALALAATWQAPRGPRDAAEIPAPRAGRARFARFHGL